MQKVAVLAHSSLRENLIDFLQTEGVLHITESGEGLKLDHTEVEYKKAELEFAISVLKERATKPIIAALQKKMSKETIIDIALHTDIQGTVEELHKLEEEDSQAEKVLNEKRGLMHQLKPWSTLPYPLNQVQKSEYVVAIFGSLPVTQSLLAEKELQEQIGRINFEVIGNSEGLDFCCIHVWKENQVKCEEIMTRYGWTEISLPALEERPAEIIAEAEKNIAEQSRIKEKNERRRRELAKLLPNLMATLKYFLWLDQKQEAREAMVATSQTVTLFGWMPRGKVAALEAKLMRLSKAIALIKVKPDENEEVPVAIKNPKLITPFESVTGLYGLPLHHEFDPTLSLSPFFILYFALCLTDAGYGLILALVFGVYLFISKKSIEEARLWWLMFFSGIVTFFVSIPFGGWFGLAPEQVPAFLTYEGSEGLMFKGQLWNLGKQSGIDFLQNLSLFLGITHLFFGMFLAGLHKWLHGKKMEAVWSNFTPHLLLVSAIFFALTGKGMMFENLNQVAGYILYTSIALLIWGKGCGSPWYIRPVMGVLGFVNLGIGLLSNGLSYLRILALGLVTGALASAVNQVAVELGNLFPIYLAVPIVIIICIGGHLVSIALNALGSFIHSGRLQFIEFFGQFFEGGGQPYSPFRHS